MEVVVFGLHLGFLLGDSSFLKLVNPRYMPAEPGEAASSYCHAIILVFGATRKLVSTMLKPKSEVFHSVCGPC